MFNRFNRFVSASRAANSVRAQQKFTNFFEIGMTKFLIFLLWMVFCLLLIFYAFTFVTSILIIGEFIV